MKVCPHCNQTYADETLNFCLNDGSILQQQTSGVETPTVLLNHPRQTISNQQQFGTAVQHNNTNWGIVTPNAAAQPKRKSRAWLWVLGIFGGIILLCGGGFAALIALVPDNPKPANYNSGSYNNSGINRKDSSSTSSSKDNLASWKPASETFGNTEYKNSELVMASRQTGYYYVLVTPKSDFRTENATTKVTAKNTTGGSTQYGFGLLIHSDLKSPLSKDYAFVIDTYTQKYRIARHTKQDEKTVVEWTYSDSIKPGSQENVLEVKDENGRMSFYINGDYMTVYTDTYGYKSGNVGLYVSDAVPIAFSDLEIRK